MTFAALVATADRLLLQSLGETVSYMPRQGPHVGETVELAGIFQNAYELAEIGQAGVMSSAPAVFVRASDLPGYGEELRDFAEDDAEFTVKGKTYRARESKPDGEGGILFVLYEAA